MESIFYNIHDLLRIRINRPSMNEFVRDLNQPLSYFQVQKVGVPDVILNIGNFVPQNTNCEIINHKIYVKDDYIYSAEIIDKIACHTEITGLEAQTTVINAYTQRKTLRQRLLPSLMAQNIILRPIIDYKLMQKGVASVHAAGFAKNGSATVLAGRGGAHKTTLMMDVIRRFGYQFIGEDRLLLGQDGQVFAYPLYHQLFSYRLSKMETEEYKPFDKIKYLFYQKASSIQTDYIENRARFKSLFSIVKHTKSTIDYRLIPKSEIVKKITKSQQMENLNSPGIMKIKSGRLYEYFAAYAYCFPHSKVANYWIDCEELLHTLLDAEEYVEVYIPQEYNHKTLDRLLDIIDRGAL